MNISTYIFGSLGNGYSQYPNDYAQTIFQSIYAQSSAPTQIVVHREDKLIYYAYVRKLEAGQYIGLCVVLNSVMLTDFKEMFSIFENLITSLVVNGIILQFNDKGDIVSKASQLYTNQAEVSRVTDNLRNEFSKLENTSKPLPPVSYGIARNEKRTFSVGDNTNDIVKASVSYNYTFIFKRKDFDTQSLSSYRGVLNRLHKEKSALESKCEMLKSQNTKLRNKQRNTLWVGILSVVIAVLGGVLYFKVLNPSEVTRYQTEHFLYYGPMQNKQPHGEGVAFYPKDDQDGRRYYIGHFINGNRQDTTAMLYYQNGDYFYGSMDGDKFLKGIFYSNSDGSHFEGSFVDNKPYDGTWYNHEESYMLKDGEMK